MRQFTIKKLEHFSGIKAHTIRIWEKRYQIFTPERRGRIRRYTLDDVRKLLNVSILINHGFRISSICNLDINTVELKIAGMITKEAINTSAIRDLIHFAYSGEIFAFEDLLDNTVQKQGINNTIRHIIIPFLEKIDLLSYNDTSPEAHFIVTAIRRKLILGIEMLQPQKKDTETVLLFLPEAEHYDLILLYLNYVMKEKGCKVYYLGTNISGANFENVLKSKKLDKIYTYLTDDYKTDIKRYMRITENSAPGAEFCILTKIAPIALKGLPYKPYKEVVS